MFKTFGRLNVKQRSLRPEGMVWFDPIYHTRSRVNPSRRNWRCYLQMVCHVCVNVNEMCEWDDVWKWVKENERWGGEGRKEERNTNLQKHLRKHKWINFSSGDIQLTSSQRCQTLLWLLQRTNKYVLTNNHIKCHFKFQSLIISSVTGKRRTFFSKLGYGLDFWLVALSAKDVGSVSLWTGFSTLDFECNSCLRPLVVWMWNRGHWDLRVWYDLTRRRSIPVEVDRANFVSWTQVQGIGLFVM